MAWTAAASNERITRFLSTVPATSVAVEDFETFYFARRQAEMRVAVARGLPAGQPITALPLNRAVLTDGVHVYANLLGYNSKLLEQGRETEASHRRTLQFLHLHYSACDRLIEAYDVQRIDFHGGRLHAVVLTPVGRAAERERVVKAISFAAAFRRMVEEGARAFGATFDTEVRIGIDTGRAVAVNSGKRSEPEPLFLGNPANKAAKLAEGDEGGVFLSPRAQAVLSASVVSLGDRQVGPLEESSFLSDALVNGVRDGRELARRVEATIADFRSDTDLAGMASSPASFVFHRHEPPLKTIKFEELSPSRSIRMELVSLFADLSGFTAYVEHCMASGQVGQLVTNLHVLRGEFAAVLRDDFGGRKVRFIGDCLHGMIAEGTSAKTDDTKTVRTAVLCAGALRSSFELCQRRLPGVGQLGLTIGMEHGPTPVTRLGIRGERSVRCSSSRAVSGSEAEQARCDNGRQTAMGEVAFANAGHSIRQAFWQGRKIEGLNYLAAVAFADVVSSGVTVMSDPEPLRAHAKPA